MAVNRHHRGEGGWIVGVLTGLLVVLIPMLVVWCQDRMPRAQETGQGIAVQPGRLSVDLRRADIRTVLEQIGQQAGVRMVFAQNSTRKVSAQFADVELEEGLRRLLQLASLSYIVLYGQGPTGASVVQEVRVYGEKEGMVEPLKKNEATPTPQEAAERDIEADDANDYSIDNPLRKLQEQILATAQLSLNNAPREAAPLSEQEAVSLLRGVFRPPEADNTIEEQGEEPVNDAGSSR